MEIKVFGPGCAKCNLTADTIKEIAAEKGCDATIVKISDFKEMMMAGIMATPAVAVDGVVKCTGRIPTKEEIAAWLDGGEAASSSSRHGGGCSCGGKC